MLNTYVIPRMAKLPDAISVLVITSANFHISKHRTLSIYTSSSKEKTVLLNAIDLKALNKFIFDMLLLLFCSFF